MSEPSSYYCIVCQKMIPLENASSVSASIKWGGWYCGWHKLDDLQKAKERLGGVVLDHLGNVPIHRDVVPFRRDEVKKYIDRCIRFWRDKQKSGDSISEYYIDAFQSVRTSLFGELLPKEDSTE